MPGIFISYRRQDAAPWAGRIYDWLTNYWGRNSVFMDIDTIAPGEDFRVAISKTLTECDVALVVIGPKWLTATDEAGARRLDDAGDVHRTEVTSALARDDVRVVPVLVGDAMMPRTSDLPEALQGLIYRNAAFIEDLRFGADMHALNEALVQFAERLAAERRSAEDTTDHAIGRPADSETTELRPPTPESDADADVSRLAPPVFVSRTPAPPPPTETMPTPSDHGEPDAPARDGASDDQRRRILIAAIGAALVLVVVVAVALALAGGGGGGDDDTAQFDVDVPGNRAFTDTGIDLAVGDRLVINASGTVLHNRDSADTEVGPEGASDADTRGTDLNQPGRGVWVRPPGHGGLIGKIGDQGNVFGVGESLDVQVATAGRLSLGINDFNGGDVNRAVANNDGEFDVEIEVTHPASG